MSMVSISELHALRVVMYTPSPQGGHARYTRELLQALTELGGCSVELVTCIDGLTNELYAVHPILPRQRKPSEFVSKLHWAVSRVFYYSRRERVFMRWLREHPTDIVHLQEFTPWLGRRHIRSMRRLGARVVVTVHNIRPHAGRQGPLGWGLDHMHRAMWRKADCLVVHSDVLADQLSRFLGQHHPAIAVTAHGAWTEVAAPQRGSLVSAPGIAGGHLLFFGVLRSNKGLETIISALDNLPTVHLTIAGAPSDERYHRYIRRLIADRTDGRVSLIDHFVPDEEVAYLFQQCDLLVLPYTSFAAQSGVLHLAITYGLPVVVTDVGALGETVRRFSLGEVVPPGDASQMATAIHNMLQPHRLSQARRDLAAARQALSWSAQAVATLAVYNRALGLDRMSA